jgi:hypothetical protein
MTTTQHTPGPWSQGEDNPLNIYGNHASVANVHGTHPTGASTEEEAIANARLIAAAPELLAALRLAKNAIDAALPWLHPDGYRKNALEVEDPQAYCGEIYEDITAAIAAATGEEVQA